MILPVFVIITGAIFDLGWLFYQQSAIHHATREGCRAGASAPADVDAEQVATTSIETALLEASVDCGGSCSVTVSTTGTTPLQLLECQVTGTFRPLFGLAPGFSAIDMQNAYKVRREVQP